MRRALSAFAGLTLLASLLAGCGRGGAAPETAAAPDGPLAVEALAVTRGALVRSVQASGIVSGINEAHIVSETQGIIQRVFFELGDLVEAGQVLIQVDDTIPRLNMEQARQQYETVSFDLQATERLFNQGGASQAELIRARSAASSAEVRYQSALKALRDCSIKATIGGYVAQKDPGIGPGDYLSPGLRVARIVDMSSLKMEIAVGEGQVGLIEEGAAATVLIPAACEQRMFEAKVKAVAAGSDPATGSFPVIVSWNNPCGDGVKSGMSATVTIRTRNQEPVILVPSSALVEREGEVFVLTAESGKATRKAVQVGRKLGNTAEVLEGLEVGEILIISALSYLRRGDPVQPTIVGESGSWQ